MNAAKKEDFKNNRNVIGVGEVETIVVDYVPQNFPIKVSKPASGFFKQEVESPTDFKISELVSKQVGINQLEKTKVEEKIEAEILVRIKDVEERAYKEAYELGFQEGTEKAFVEKKDEINSDLDSLKTTLESIQNYNKDLLAKKESQILNLIHKVAERIALFEIKNQPKQLAHVIESLFSEIQSEERVVIKISKSDYENFEALKKNSDVSFEFLENSKLDVDNSISPGGCKMSSNYGQIDATVEQRVAKVWSVIEENLPSEIELVDELAPSKTEDSEDEGNE